MKFRPCIDIHNGRVKQIVGASLTDADGSVKENFASEYSAAYYAAMYREDQLKGGHVIMLNPVSSPCFEATRREAVSALEAFPGGLQIGGGITAENAGEYIDAGASHVIVTSYVFHAGDIHWGHLNLLTSRVGRHRVVLDLSCRKRNGVYFVVTDRWQKYTNQILNKEILSKIGAFCDEILVHAVDVEGRAAGLDSELVAELAAFEDRPVTYAGGISSLEDIRRFYRLTEGKTDFTIGSALDIFGGKIRYRDISRIREWEKLLN